MEIVVCKICCDEFSIQDEWFELSCGHAYCKECLNRLIEVLVNQGGVLAMLCPQPGCGESMKSEEIKTLCSPETHKKYICFSELAALRADPNVRWCPVLKCSNYVRGPPTDPLIDWLACGTCGAQVCFKCGEERHDPAQCGQEAQELLASRHAEFVESQRTFEEWKAYKKNDVKQCPGCKGFIEKNMGCNHMTCRACKYQFCWLCGTKYQGGHFSNPTDFPDCNGKQYWYPPVPPDPELQKKFNWIYFPPSYQYAQVDASEKASRRKANRKKKAKKVGVWVGVGIAAATIGVPVLIIGGPIYGAVKLVQKLKHKEPPVSNVLRR